MRIRLFYYTLLTAQVTSQSNTPHVSDTQCRIHSSPHLCESATCFSSLSFTLFLATSELYLEFWWRRLFLVCLQGVCWRERVGLAITDMPNQLHPSTKNGSYIAIYNYTGKKKKKARLVNQHKLQFPLTGQLSYLVRFLNITTTCDLFHGAFGDYLFFK